MPGKLFVIATPIGNLGDITLRALEVLKSVTVIVAENPGVTKRLASALGLGPKKWVECAAHNEHKSHVWVRVKEALDAGELCAVVSDAGAPMISDPGATLISQAIEEGIAFEVIPGASSVITALQHAAYHEAYAWTFHGFLNWVDDLSSKTCPPGAAHVFFLSPHRGEKEIKKLCQQFPQAHMTLCFEMTKKFERIIRFKASELEEVEFEWRGECTCVLFQPKSNEPDLQEGSGSINKNDLINFSWDLYHKHLELTPRQFSKKLGQIIHLSAQEIYAKGVKKDQ